MINRHLVQNFGLEKNAFVSFTSLEKLGINPQSGFDTPLAICSYPLIYVLSKMQDKWSANVLPFAGNQPYANCFSAKGNVLDITHMTPEQSTLYYKKVQEFCLTQGFKKDDFPQLKKEARRTAFSKSLGGIFWNFTNILSTVVGDMSGRKSSIFWNQIFRAIGIDGFVDNGGILHHNEPVQAMFFHINAVENIKRYDNKWSDETKLAGISYRDSIQKVSDAISQNDDNALFDVLKNDSKLIKMVKNPSVNLILRLFDYGRYFIRYFQHAPIETLKKVIDKNESIIIPMDDPPLELQLHAVKNNPKIVPENSYFDWAPEAKALAIKLDPRLAGRIE